MPKTKGHTCVNMSPSHPWSFYFFITGRYWLSGCLVRYAPGHFTSEMHGLVTHHH